MDDEVLAFLLTNGAMIIGRVDKETLSPLWVDLRDTRAIVWQKHPRVENRAVAQFMDFWLGFGPKIRFYRANMVASALEYPEELVNAYRQSVSGIVLPTLPGGVTK